MNSFNCKKENPERIIHECCKTCDYYRPKFWRMYGKECAAFGTVDGVKDNKCGLYCNAKAARETR